MKHKIALTMYNEFRLCYKIHFLKSHLNFEKNVIKKGGIINFSQKYSLKLIAFFQVEYDN